MIKNNAQLTQAKERIRILDEKLNLYKNNLEDFASRSMVISAEKEKRELEGEVEEYISLRDLPFEEAVNTVLHKHMLLDNIGELLSKIRIAAKKSQAELSRDLGWEQSNLSRFESENYSSQTVGKIIEYASSLGVWLHVTPSLEENIDFNFSEKFLSQFRKNISANKILASGTGSDSPSSATSVGDFSTSVNMDSKSVELRYLDLSGKPADPNNMENFFVFHNRSEKMTEV